MKALVYRGVRWVLFCFSLSAIQAGAIPETPVPLPAATVKLSGITTLFGDKRALLVVRENATAGTAARKEYSCILVEGQSSGPIEVVKIDEQNGRVKIRNGEVESELSFARDGVQPPPAPRRAPANQRVHSGRRASNLAPSIPLPESQPALVQSAITIPEPVREVIVPQSQFIVFGRSSPVSYHSPLGYGSRRRGSYSSGNGYASYPNYSSSSYDDSCDSSYSSYNSRSSYRSSHNACRTTSSSSSVACNNRSGGGWHGSSDGGRSGGGGHRGGDHNGGSRGGGSRGGGSTSSHASSGGSKSK